jgi:epoxyqueuosine reductase
MSRFTDTIRAKAREVGFERVGIVPAAALPDEKRQLDEWLGRGFNGHMAWMARDPEKRADPTLLMPGARSIVVVAHNYYTPHQHAETGKISRYAWGDDYHDILREKLSKLYDWIKEQRPETNGKICVDTAPFMDKAWAVRAGLGWLGKHTNLITTTHGSWVFIGSLILDITLDYDRETVEDHCGTCTACIDACPTGAIVQPYVVDSRQCISYATIELRDEELPAKIEPALNGWLYGCDICQDVCPWNRFQTPTQERRFNPRNAETSLDVDSVITMEHDEYAKRFRRSAIKRAKLSGLKRNASALVDDLKTADRS